MNTFTSLHARFYDLVYADKPYDREARWVDELIRRGERGTLLDLACGTGRHALELAALGWEVTGVDFSPELLDHAVRRAGERGLDVRFARQDMRELDLDGARFDAVTCLFDSIGYPEANEGVVATLAGARSHLAPGGRVAVEFLHAAAMVRHFSPARVRRLPTDDGGTLLRVSESRLDLAASVMVVDYELVHLHADATGYDRAAETQRNRFFTLEEMRALMSAAGLLVERFLPAYEGGESIDDGTWHVLALAVEDV